MEWIYVVIIVIGGLFLGADSLASLLDLVKEIKSLLQTLQWIKQNDQAVQSLLRELQKLKAEREVSDDIAIPPP